MAKELVRDPQIDSLLAARKHELGIRSVGGDGISMALLDQLGRGRNLGISM